MDYEIIATTPEGQEVNLATLGFDTDINVADLTLVSVGDVDMSETALSELMQTKRTLAELQDAISALGLMFNARDIDVLREQVDVDVLADNVDGLQFYANYQACFDEKVLPSIDMFDEPLRGTILDNLDVYDTVESLVDKTDTLVALLDESIVDISDIL